MLEVISLPRRGGKTTQAIEILRSNENNIMFTHMGIRKELLDSHLNKRVFTSCDYKQRLRGKILDTVIIDDADLLDKHLLLDMLHHFTTFPYTMNGLSKIVLTITTIEDKVQESPLKTFHDNIMEIFFCACNALNHEDDLEEHTFKFCSDTIVHTLNYLKSKRKE